MTEKRWTVSVNYDNESLASRAQALAQQLDCSLNTETDYCLIISEKGLALKMPNFSPLFADFSSAHSNKRHLEGKKQGLVRACKPQKGLKIIDATAGWGRDAALLAGFGAEVLMIERNPIMAALLADALIRQSESDKQLIKLALYPGDSFSFLRDLSAQDYPDIIYIDPMHPERNKSALVKKDMQALQRLIGTDRDAQELLKLAITRVKQRVVVKWPQKAAPLLPAHSCIEGKTIRFDIYPGSSRLGHFDPTFEVIR